MRTIGMAVALLIAHSASSAALAQNEPTTVQLPTFHYFSSSTTVSVPDSGGATLGGVSSARSGSTSRSGSGPLSRGRGQAGSVSASNASVHATIIDNAALDQAVLARAGERAGIASNAQVSRANAKADFLSQHIARSQPIATQQPIDAPRAASVAAYQQQASHAAEQRAGEAAAHFAKAEQLLAAGKPALAKIYYEMAARRDSGDIAAKAQAQLARLATGNRTVASRE